MDNDIVKLCKLNEDFSKKLYTFSKPLLDFSGATYFHFDHITHNCKLWAMNTNPEFFNFYFLGVNGLKNDFIYADINLLIAHVFVWHTKIDEIRLKKQNRLNRALKAYFDVDGGICFNFPSKTGAYGLSFSGSLQNRDFINMLLKEKTLIENFKDQLVGKFSDEINLLKEIELDLSQKAPIDREKTLQSNRKINFQNKKTLLLGLGQISENDLELMKIKPTNRERQCALLFLNNYTIEEAGEFLGISGDAVKSYLHRLKTKYHAKSKKELMEKLNILKKLDYFAADSYLDYWDNMH